MTVVMGAAEITRLAVTVAMEAMQAPAVWEAKVPAVVVMAVMTVRQE